MVNLSRGVLFFSLLILSFQTVGASNIEKIDINSASVEDLVKIIHIGEVRAEKLISLRPFSSLDDLIRIKGIGQTKLEDIKKQGLAWVSTEPQSEPQPESELPPQEEYQPITYPSGILINEITPSPEGPDKLGEWVELKNINNEEVDLSKWKIQDTTGSVTAYTFSEGTKIGPNGFLVLSRPTTKITLNNSGDGLLLIQPNGNILDTITYEKAPRGQSYNRTKSGWDWSTILTPGSVNIVLSSILKTEATESDKENTEELTSPKESRETQKQLAAIGEQIPKSSKSLYIFLIALGLAIFSGIIILFLKKQLKINYNKNL